MRDIVLAGERETKLSTAVKISLQAEMSHARCWNPRPDIEFNQRVHNNKYLVMKMTRSLRPLLRCGTTLPGVMALIAHLTLVALLAVPVTADARDGGGGNNGGGSGGGHAGAMGGGIEGGGGRGDVHIHSGEGGAGRGGGMPNGGGRMAGSMPSGGGVPPAGHFTGGYVSAGPVAVQNPNTFGYGDRSSRDNEGPYFPEDEFRYAPRCYLYGGPHCHSGSHLRYGSD